MRSSRAFFFDNSSNEMRYLADFSAPEGFTFHVPESELPRWFKGILHK